MNAVLYIDDREEELQTLRGMIGDQYRLVTCRDGRRASALIAARRPDLVLLDIDMRGCDGFQVLSEIRSMRDPPPVVMLSGHNAPFFVVRALKEGAVDFFSKPYGRALMRTRLERLLPEAGRSPARPAPSSPERILIGASPAMEEARKTLECYAKASAPVLVLGESGTGKDRAARYLHEISARSGGPFVARNMAAVPATLLESELFGSEKGAYTDAREREGCFSAARGGTLFLDEIAEAGAAVQAALLRVVEDGQVRKLGADESREADCRLVFATNRELEELAGGGAVRKDLLFRIATLPVVLPPLRDRREDIPELVESFLEGIRYPERQLKGDALAFLMERSWPGNVRQLKSCVERAAALAEGGPVGIEHVRVQHAERLFGG